MLSSQLGRNVSTYVDDIIVRSMKQQSHISDLQETITNFRRVGLKLNHGKCVFGVKKGKFLRCLVSTKGIEATPHKIEAILWIEPPKSRKGAWRLAEKLASLNRFCFEIHKAKLAILRSFEISRSVSVGSFSKARF
jgi:hypothetical protein